MQRHIRHVASVAAVSLLLSACDTMPTATGLRPLARNALSALPSSLPVTPPAGQQGQPTGQPPAESEGGAVVAKTSGCVLGAVAAGFLGKVLAAAEAKRKKLSPAATAKLERSYMLGLGMLGCGGGALLAGTAYAKLSEAGKQARERELVEAASSARPRTYADPGNPTLKGRIVPGVAYAEAGNRECRDVEDTLSDAGKGEPAVVKMCRSLPNGGWTPSTTA